MAQRFNGNTPPQYPLRSGQSLQQTMQNAYANSRAQYSNALPMAGNVANISRDPRMFMVRGSPSRCPIQRGASAPSVSARQSRIFSRHPSQYNRLHGSPSRFAQLQSAIPRTSNVGVNPLIQQFQEFMNRINSSAFDYVTCLNNMQSPVYSEAPNVNVSQSDTSPPCINDQNQVLSETAWNVSSPTNAPLQMMSNQSNLPAQDQTSPENKPAALPNSNGTSKDVPIGRIDGGSDPSCTPQPDPQCVCMRQRQLAARRNTSFEPDTCAPVLKSRQLFKSLVQDRVPPGIIQETLDGSANFNATAFDLLFGCNIPDQQPEVEPLTLLEAFYMRVNHERQLLEGCIRSNIGYPQQLNVASIDLHFSKQCPTELNKALSCLFKAERIDEFHDPKKPRFEADISSITARLAETTFSNCDALFLDTYTGQTKQLLSDSEFDFDKLLLHKKNNTC